MKREQLSASAAATVCATQLRIGMLPAVAKSFSFQLQTDGLTATSPRPWNVDEFLMLDLSLHTLVKKLAKSSAEDM